MLSLSATLVRRVVYMKPVPADDTSLAMTTLLCERCKKIGKRVKLSALLPFLYQSRAELLSMQARASVDAYRAFDLAAIVSNRR